MDDTPSGFLEELRTGVLKRMVGKLALAIVLGLSLLTFLNNTVSFLFIPILSRVFNRTNPESVLFQSKQPFDWFPFVGATMQFLLAVVAVFYLHRWVNKPMSSLAAQGEEYEDEMMHGAEAPAATSEPGEPKPAGTSIL